MGSTDYPDFLLVSETLHPLHRLTVSLLGTSLYSSFIRHTQFTSVSWRASL